MMIDTIDTSKLIVLEGLEGAGKSSAIETIQSWFNTHKPQNTYLFTREPGGTFLAEKIRQLLITDYKEEHLTAESELLLMYASRMQHVQNLMIPQLNEGKWVISDRFFWSSFAYQGGGRGLGLEKVKQIHHALLGNFQAGLTIFLDLDPLIGLQRIKNREIDRIEKEQLSFFTEARNMFLALAQNNPKAAIVDASKPIFEVQKAIIEIISAYVRSN